RQPCRDDRADQLAAMAWTGQAWSRSHRATRRYTEATAGTASPAALKMMRLLGELETHACGQSDIIIDYATARRRDEPISTAVSERAVQWLMRRRLSAQQQMRWTARAAHLLLE